MTFYVGQTIKIGVKNLKDVDGQPIQGPTVTFVITAPDESTTTPPTTFVSGEWRAIFAPTKHGAHVARVTAAAQGGTWKAEQMIYVHDFS